MTSLQIETAHIQDIPALIHVEHLCFTTDRLSVRQFRHFIQSSTALVAVAKTRWQNQEDCLMGYALVLFRLRSKIAGLYSIAVRPDYQHRGVARALNSFIEEHCMARHCDEMRLEVRKDNQHAMALYKKNGYELFGEYKQFYEDGADAWRMYKRLTRDNVKLKQN